MTCPFRGLRSVGIELRARRTSPVRSRRRHFGLIGESLVSFGDSVEGRL